MNLTFYLFAEWLKMNDEEILELQMAEVELLEAAYENELDFETKEVCLFFVFSRIPHFSCFLRWLNSIWLHPIIRLQFSSNS